MKSDLRKIIITTGDQDGIGPEIAAKSLARLGPQRGSFFLCIVGLKPPQQLIKKMGSRFKIVDFQSWPEAIEYVPKSHKELALVRLASRPAKWIEMAGAACLHKRATALVTGPLSKPEIQSAGLSDVGHTDILKRVCSTRDAWMAFVGKYFHVFLASGHVPICKVEGSLTTEKLELSLKAAHQFFHAHAAHPKKKKWPVAVLGLNPHAGDSGLIGRFDQDILLPIIERLNTQGFSFYGPLVPDVAFQRYRTQKFLGYVALYHDQGLIPFKLAHGHRSGVHVTVGLPIIRTSVDHGTAKDIFGKNMADPSSMVLAIRQALALAGG